MRNSKLILLWIAEALITGALCLLPRIAAAQSSGALADTTPAQSDAPTSDGWAGDPLYLFVAPTGHTLDRGDLLAGLRGVPDAPTALLDYGVADRVTLTAGYLAETYGGDQDGEALLGASVQLGSRDLPIAVRARVHLPINHWLGRRLGDVELIGVSRWGDSRWSVTAGAGWRGNQSLCRPEWQMCQEEWHGYSFALVGGGLSLGEHVALVSENHLRFSSLETSTGIRAGIGGLSVGAAVGCGAYVGMGVAARCDGFQLGASYRFRFSRY